MFRVRLLGVALLVGIAAFSSTAAAGRPSTEPSTAPAHVLEKGNKWFVASGLNGRGQAVSSIVQAKTAAAAAEEFAKRGFTQCKARLATGRDLNQIGH